MKKVNLVFQIWQWKNTNLWEWRNGIPFLPVWAEVALG
ncbi:hypothetical protein L915_08168 [Phytophthora nicotianae]|uniref:Uncharacterized protein n=1 Tax=Phytophthora nicotianae TaxID=4792 RepID=W2GWQ6_PHYNI|nr:hypothetical protein L915_08168 [Phytophthora nicotianae]ETL40831.1 hypothetical protein L916_08090 [Phytophthora nicotianae]